jgi:hypothetical protein
MTKERTVLIDGCNTPFDVAIKLMDDKLRESLQTKEFKTDQDFVDAYADAHRRKFGEPFYIE